MAPTTRSATAPAREAAETKEAAAILATLQGHDFIDIPDRPAKRPRVTREMRVRAGKIRTDASRQAVLQTHELLECILSLLSPQALFVNQRVCKQWRNVITSSPELQKKIFLRVNKVPLQKWGVKVDYSSSHVTAEVRRTGEHPMTSLPFPWQLVSPILLSPRLKHYDDMDEESRLRTGDTTAVLQLPRTLRVSDHSSILDTHISNPPCYHFSFYLSFRFEPAIPHYSHLEVNNVHFRTNTALKVGEALNAAMSVQTDVILAKDKPLRSNMKIEDKSFRSATVTQVIKELQDEYECTAILIVGDLDSNAPASMMVLHDVYVSNEQEWAKVDAGYAKAIQQAQQ